MIKIIDANDFLLEKKSKSDDVIPNVAQTVSNIIRDVKLRGDAALLEYTKKFDGADISALEVSQEEFDEALAMVEPEFVDIIKQAKDNIYNFHMRQKRDGFTINDKTGVVLGQRIIPLARVGLYIPGGTASYPSSVLMNCIPAKIAGVNEIIMTTPPMKNGKVSPVILAAAKIAGVDKVYKVGGAQAIAAMAYGTDAIKQVDKIVGPGNAYVAEAKRQVFGTVAIDMIAGPSEILIIADETCRANIVAADMLSQAEHDRVASAYLVTESKSLADAVAEQLEVQLKALPREEIARTSIENNGRIIIVEDIDSAIEIANEIAPEHLELCVDTPFDYLPKVRNAGSVFLGKNCPEALGDYFAGTNHTLPTSGTARFSSPLSVDDFIKKYSFTYYTKEALAKEAKKIEYFADKEGLHAHARSAVIRFDEEI